MTKRYDLVIIRNFNAGDNWGGIPMTRLMLLDEKAKRNQFGTKQIDGMDFDSKENLNENTNALLKRNSVKMSEVHVRNRFAFTVK